MKLLLPALLCLCIGCGGGGGSSSPTPAPLPHPPGIANMVYNTPHIVNQNTGGGAVIIQWTFGFIDAGGDITTASIDLLDPTGTILRTISTTLTGTTGLTSGTIQLTVAGAGTTAIGSFPFQFYVTDLAANRSNILSGLFQVVPLGAASSIKPDIDNLAKPEEIRIIKAVVIPN